MFGLIIFYGVIFTILIVLGIVFSCGKGAFLIAGYNTSSKENKDSINEKLLCRFMGKLMFLLTGCWLIICLGGIIHYVFLIMIGTILFIISILGATVYANTGNRFKK